MRPDIHEPRFTSADVCRAAGVPAATLANWISRKPATIRLGEHDTPAGGSTGTHLFTLNRIVQVALTAELVTLGIPPRDAAWCAFAFTDTEEPSYLPWTGREDRARGELFREGRTVLLAGVGFAQIVNMAAGVPLDVLIRQRGAASAVVVDVNAVVARVRAALDA